RWFFDREPIDPHHFNQALLLEETTPIRPAVLACAAQELVRHHDALRLRFTSDGHTWQQVNDGDERNAVFTQIDLRGLTTAARTRALEAAAAQAQRGFDLSRGPLFRVLQLGLGEHTPARVLLAAHHLVVDGVSWRILLEDLQVLCTALERRHLQ